VAAASGSLPLVGPFAIRKAFGLAVATHQSSIINNQSIDIARPDAYYGGCTCWGMSPQREDPFRVKGITARRARGLAFGCRAL